MSSTYTGNPAGATPAVPFSFTEPSDGDAATVASVNGPSTGPFQPTGDFVASINQQLVASLLLNLTDNGAVNSMTSVNDMVWASSLGLWVAVGAAGAISTSPDLLTWTARTSNVARALNSVVWSGSLLVAVGAGGSTQPPIITTSPDGVTWTSQTTGGTNNTNLNQVAWDPTLALYCAVSSSGYVLTSSNATSWTKTTVGSATALNGVASNGAGTFLLVGTDGTNNAWTTTNGTSWTAQVISGLSTTGRAVAYSADLSKFLVLDGTGTAKSALSTSSAGTAWSSAVATTVASSSFIGPALKWTGRAFVAHISSSQKTLQYTMAGVTWYGHTPPLLAAGSVQLEGTGINSDTGQLAYGTTGGHAYVTKLLPIL